MKILVIDDKPDFVGLFQALLVRDYVCGIDFSRFTDRQKGGLPVFPNSDAVVREIIRQIEEIRPGVILLDGMLNIESCDRARTNDIEILEALSRLPVKIPVVGISTLDQHWLKNYWGCKENLVRIDHIVSLRQQMIELEAHCISLYKVIDSALADGEMYISLEHLAVPVM